MTSEMTESRGELIAFLDNELRAPVSQAANALSERVRSLYGDSVLAVLYYGSCFRSGTETDGILDIFVIIDNYRAVYSSRALAVANRVLPPNVFYIEMVFEDTVLRSKYAIISLEQFIQRTSRRCFHTFFWARFAQPCALTFTRDDAVHKRIAGALAEAVDTVVQRTLPLLPSTFDAAALWTTALSASYKTELRPEPGDAATRLVAKNIQRYEIVTRLALNSGAADDDRIYRNALAEPAQRRGRLAWRVRRVQGKLINLLRIMKAAFTFDGGVDYVLWKIERHSGVKVEATPMLRRHPLLACWPTVWRLYRAGAFR